MTLDLAPHELVLLVRLEASSQGQFDRGSLLPATRCKCVSEVQYCRQNPKVLNIHTHPHLPINALQHAAVQVAMTGKNMRCKSSPKSAAAVIISTYKTHIRQDIAIAALSASLDHNNEDLLHSNHCPAASKSVTHTLYIQLPKHNSCMLGNRAYFELTWCCSLQMNGTMQMEKSADPKTIAGRNPHIPEHRFRNRAYFSFLYWKPKEPYEAMAYLANLAAKSRQSCCTCSLLPATTPTKTCSISARL